MAEITRAVIVRVGVDLTKNVIQVHAVDAAARRVVARTIKREQFLAWCAQLPSGCTVAMEACSGAHAWARRLKAMGVDTRLIAASFASPYRREGKSGKTNSALLTSGGVLAGALAPCPGRLTPGRRTQSA